MTSKQELALVIITKCSAVLSIVGSSYLVHLIATDAKKRQTCFHRLLAAMSVNDIITSCWFFVGTWAAPADSGMYGAAGSAASCVAQGFFIQNGSTTVCYNASLATYYLLIINYGWKEQSLRKVHPWLHAASLTFGLGTSFVCLALDLYSPAGLWCWITGRNSLGSLCRWLFFYGPLWFISLYITVTMCLIYRYVVAKERAVEKYDFAAGHSQRSLRSHYDDDDQESVHSVSTAVQEHRSNRRKHSMRVARQGFYYVGAFYITWVGGTLTRLLQLINGQTYFPIVLLWALFSPMQGFINFLVYMRPRWLKHFDEQRQRRNRTSTTRTRIETTPSFCHGNPNDHGRDGASSYPNLQISGWGWRLPTSLSIGFRQRSPTSSDDGEDDHGNRCCGNQSDMCCGSIGGDADNSRCINSGSGPSEEEEEHEENVEGITPAFTCERDKEKSQIVTTTVVSEACFREMLRLELSRATGECQNTPSDSPTDDSSECLQVAENGGGVMSSCHSIEEQDAVTATTATGTTDSKASVPDGDYGGTNSNENKCQQPSLSPRGVHVLNGDDANCRDQSALQMEPKIDKAKNELSSDSEGSETLRSELEMEIPKRSLEERELQIEKIKKELCIVRMDIKTLCSEIEIERARQRESG